MFVPSKPRIRALAQGHPQPIARLNAIFRECKTAVYVDWANVRHWCHSLGWHVDHEKLKELLDSFTPTKYVRFYWGTLPGAPKSKSTIVQAEQLGFIVRTKDVKEIKIFIDVLNIAQDSRAVLQRFMRKPFLDLFPRESIMHLNGCLQTHNENGKLHVIDQKCNFDVEIGIDIHIDKTQNDVDNFLLWSGDSDFADPVEQLLNEGKSVTVFGTRGIIARELHELQGQGLGIFEVRHLREFLCWNREKEGRR